MELMAWLGIQGAIADASVVQAKLARVAVRFRPRQRQGLHRILVVEDHHVEGGRVSVIGRRCQPDTSIVPEHCLHVQLTDSVVFAVALGDEGRFRFSLLSHVFPHFAFVQELTIFITREITLGNYAQNSFVLNHRHMVNTSVPHQAQCFDGTIIRCHA